MTKRENRCADCGAKFGLVVHRHGRLKFCRKACKDNFLAKLQRDRGCDRLRRSATFAPRHCWTCTTAIIEETGEDAPAPHQPVIMRRRTRSFRTKW